MLGFDAGDRRTFTNIEAFWWPFILQHSVAGTPVVLVGSKYDLNPDRIRVPEEEAAALAARLGVRE